ncbi:Na+-driven multidrug efflux pump [Bradyrhizobium sp. USDA 3686]|uniref:polysaccharide biosynthesis C-terminal domain-containing protein n=1 Tax=Bradyrhizobium canariense TaxID=255045 RepID=UPI001FEED0E7|nr:polysaccharide biosynthesis C-terminal domain-containing protein [Bradyrhizobium canariense]MBM7487970.1 Na+-driven multidrug efflux pump [Bradyrhizobium canariense]
MPRALAYAATLLFGYTLMLLNIVNGFIVRAEGNTRFSMWTMITAFRMNAVLNPFFIFSLDFGVRGAALATLISQIAAISLYYRVFYEAWRNSSRQDISHIFTSKSHQTDRVLRGTDDHDQYLSAIAVMLLYGAACSSATIPLPPWE